MWHTKLSALLDSAHQLLTSREGFQAFGLLELPLRNLYLSSIAAGSDAEFISIARSHPISKLHKKTRLRKDATTNRAGILVMPSCSTISIHALRRKIHQQ